MVSYILGKELAKYVPQSGFLSLLMTGDGKAIGTKFGISFCGRWVWHMKDHIDVGFMKLFYANYLFKDHGTYEVQDESGAQLAAEKAHINERIDKIKA